jgi:hypothetical protein
MTDEKVAPVVKALAQLAVKSWLIEQGRWVDLETYNIACESDDIRTCQLYEREALDAGVYSITVTKE